jgi:hypothetical protein
VERNNEDKGEISEMETRKKIEVMNERKIWFFEKIIKINILLGTLTKRKRGPSSIKLGTE